MFTWCSIGNEGMDPCNCGDPFYNCSSDIFSTHTKHEKRYEVCGCSCQRLVLVCVGETGVPCENLGFHDVGFKSGKNCSTGNSNHTTH